MNPSADVEATESINGTSPADPSWSGDREFFESPNGKTVDTLNSRYQVYGECLTRSDHMQFAFDILWPIAFEVLWSIAFRSINRPEGIPY